jgi:hypothetical protein
VHKIIGPVVIGWLLFLLAPVAVGATSGDLNGDGKSDIFWYRPTTGQTSYWMMNAVTATSGAVLLAHPDWKVVGSGDLNGDGKADLIWYNAATGQTSYWLMDGATPTGAAVLLTDANWKVAGIADLNGDGKADLVWYNAATSQTSYWLMNGGVPTHWAVLLADPNWRVTATADLNGDGRSDLILYNATIGQTSYSLMNSVNGNVAPTGVLLTHPDWYVTATGDLNGDGKTDLIWYNASTGQTSYWLMDGATATSAAVLLTHPNWQVTATADLNGDGKADLIWYNAATGQTSYWLMNGGTPTASGLLLTDPQWKVASGLVSSGSALKPARYQVIARDIDGLPFTGAGAIGNLTGTGGTVSLGNRGQTTLAVTAGSPFAMAASNINFRTWSRFEGSLAMLCDPTPAPGATLSKYAFVAQGVWPGGTVVKPILDVAKLANKRLYAFANCSYQSFVGSQGKDDGHDGQTVVLAFDAQGNAARVGDPPNDHWFTADDLYWMFRSTVVNGRAAFGYTASVDGTERVFIIERTFYDEIDRTEGTLRLWIEE